MRSRNLLFKAGGMLLLGVVALLMGARCVEEETRLLFPPQVNPPASVLNNQFAPGTTIILPFETPIPVPLNNF